MTEQKPNRQSSSSSSSSPRAAHPTEPLLVFRGQGMAILLPTLIGVMTFVLCFVTLQSSQRVIEVHKSLGLAASALTVFVPTTPGLSAVESDPAINRALDVLQNTGGLGRIEVLDRPATEGLIETALGEEVSSQVPLPTIITIQRARRALLDTEALQRELDRAAPGALLDDNQPARAFLAVERTRELSKSAALSILMLAAVMLVVVLIVSLTLDLQAEVLDVLFLSGASDAVILGQFTGFVFRSALLGSGFGVVLALVAHILMAPQVVTDADVALSLHVLLAILVFILTNLSAVVAARWRVQRKLKRTF